MKKIVRISWLLKWVTVGVCCALPLAEAGYWITNGYPFLEPWIHADPLPVFGTIPIVWSNLTEIQKFLAFLINLLPLSFSVISFACFAQLFAAFEKLRLFEKRNVLILKRAGWALVWWQVVYPLHTALLSLALTYRNPVGERNLSVGLGTNQIEMLAVGLSILLASWVFEEAVKIGEEQEGTI